MYVFFIYSDKCNKELQFLKNLFNHDQNTVSTSLLLNEYFCEVSLKLGHKFLRNSADKKDKDRPTDGRTDRRTDRHSTSNTCIYQN